MPASQEIVRPEESSASGRKYPLGPPNPLTGWSRPISDTSTTPKQSLTVVEADIQSFPRENYERDFAYFVGVRSRGPGPPRGIRH